MPQLQEMGAMSEAPIPGYLRAAGAAMLLWGLLGLMLLRLGDHPVRWWSLAIVFVVGGLGLLLGRRWGWPLALLEAIVNLAIGIFEVASGRADPVLATFILQIIPSGLVLWALFTPRSLAWLRANPHEVGPAAA
jgi:hypothetical protein